MDLPETPPGRLLNGPDKELVADEEIEESEIVDLLGDAMNIDQQVPPPTNNNNDNVSGKGGEEEDRSGEGPELCDEFVDEEVKDPVPDLESEVVADDVEGDVEDPPVENERPTRASRQPERYNPASGQSYA